MTLLVMRCAACGSPQVIEWGNSYKGGRRCIDCDVVDEWMPASDAAQVGPEWERRIEQEVEARASRDTGSKAFRSVRQQLRACEGIAHSLTKEKGVLEKRIAALLDEAENTKWLNERPGHLLGVTIMHRRHGTRWPAKWRAKLESTKHDFEPVYADTFEEVIAALRIYDKLRGAIRRNEHSATDLAIAAEDVAEGRGADFELGVLEGMQEWKATGYDIDSMRLNQPPEVDRENKSPEKSD